MVDSRMRGERGSHEVMRRLPIALWLRLARVFHQVDRTLIGHLRAWDLSLAQFDVLARVSAADGVITQQELADQLLVTKGNVCQLLDRLEQRGLIERLQSGRANLIRLTCAGRQLCTEILPAHEAAIEAQFAALSAGEQRELLALLRQLDRSLTIDHDSRAPCHHDPQEADES